MSVSLGSGDVVTMEDAIIALDIFEREANQTRGNILNYYAAIGVGTMNNSYVNEMRATQARVRAAASQVLTTCRFQNQNVRNYVATRLQRIEQIFNP